MEQKTKILYSVAGVVGAGLIFTSTFFGIKANKANKEKEEQKTEYVNLVQEKVDNYNGLVKKYNTLLENKKKTDASNKALSADNTKLEKDVAHWAWMYDQKCAEYNQEADLSEEFQAEIDSLAGIVSKLEESLNNKEALVSRLQDDMECLNEENGKYILANQALNDSISDMWNVFNPFIVKSWCYKGDKQDKVYFPQELSRIPETKAEFKEIKALNKEYKNQ